MSDRQNNQVTVLLADDCTAFRERLCALLREQPCIQVVGQTGSVKEAWTLVQERRPDVLVLDLQLLDGTGIDVLRRVKHSDLDCCVLMLTNHNDDIYRQECLRHGADHFLHKAAQFEEAINLISRMADHRRPQPAPENSANRPSRGLRSMASKAFPFSAPAGTGGLTISPLTARPALL